jgi:hypothetical protein
MFDSSNNNIA